MYLCLFLNDAVTRIKINSCIWGTVAFEYYDYVSTQHLRLYANYSKDVFKTYEIKKISK